MPLTNTPRLLDQLSALTAIRDLELLEFSLLKTLHYSFRPAALVLLRLNNKGNPLMEIRFGEQQCEVRHEDIEVPDDLEMAAQYLRDAKANEYVIRSPGRLRTIYNLYATRSSSLYLIVTTTTELSRQDAHLVSGMLQIYRNFCFLLRESQTDQLTGLANRKTFDECITKIHSLTSASMDPYPNERRRDGAAQYWLAMVDIDHFKLVNDRFGHLYGDEVLMLLAQILISTFREDDFVFRFGGEEFVLLVRTSDMTAARAALERLRRVVAEYTFPQIGQVTISIGCTRFTPEVFVATLLDYADQALYFSKKNGRNMVTFFEDMVAKGDAAEEIVESGSIELF